MSEYAIALCVVAVATVVAIQLFSEQIGGAFERSSDDLSAK
jgi:Flp pilus assembly pilin Flp